MIGQWPASIGESFSFASLLKLLRVRVRVRLRVRARLPLVSVSVRPLVIVSAVDWRSWIHVLQEIETFPGLAIVAAASQACQTRPPSLARCATIKRWLQNGQPMKEQAPIIEHCSQHFANSCNLRRQPAHLFVCVSVCLCVASIRRLHSSMYPSMDSVS